VTDFRFAVVSDIHAGDERSDWTYVKIEPPVARRHRHPLCDLQLIIDQDGIRCDYLIVPGDIANQADPKGLNYAWRRLHEIADQLGARILSAPGNHDVITHDAAADPREMLKSLLPSFPTGDVDLDSEFWAKGWCSIEEPEHRILILDSTSGFPVYPVGVDKASPEWDEYKRQIDRGSITESIENEIEGYIAGLSERKINVALIHHHPQEHQLRDYLQDEYGPMFRGGSLLELFSKYPQGGRWIIIHGHKHIPQLVNAISSSSNGPLILCAASLGAQLWSPVNTVTRNQFHVLSVSNETIPGVGSICGTVESFTWGYGDGWSRSERRGSGLPGRGGFGCTIDSATLSQQIVTLMDEASLEFMPYPNLLARVPHLPYQLPRDFESLEDDLERVGFNFDRDRHDRITQLSRKVSGR
jgi:hypothetical protein